MTEDDKRLEIGRLVVLSAMAPILGFSAVAGALWEH